MSVEIKIPSVGESVSEVELGEWLKAEGDAVAPDETIVMLESDKATVELPSPSGGVLGKILKKQGDTALIGEVIALLEDGSALTATSGTALPAGSKEAPTGSGQIEGVEAPQAQIAPDAGQETPGPTPAPGANGLAVGTDGPQTTEAPRAGLSSDAIDQDAGQAPRIEGASTAGFVMPAAARELAQNGLSAQDVAPSGPGGRVLKEDVARAVEAKTSSSTNAPAPQTASSTKAPSAPAKSAAPKVSSTNTSNVAEEEIVRMTPLRRKIAQRLVEAQQTAALLTTFNEIDMSAAMDLRKQHQDSFTKKYGIKLGFMSFFVKAVIDGLKQFPAINAEVRGEDIVYKNHYDIGVAIGGGKALVVPVLRRAERMSFAEIELAIAEYAARVKSGKITPDELIGGTFTITNGGVYGSLLSTPIVNPPQSGILGMHTIQERPIALDGQVVIRPMMYIALTYDHRIVDGREAVSFLKRVKECLENPSRMLLEV